MNKLEELSQAGTAVWLDFIERRFVESGELARLIAQDGVTGVTSNPAIFEKAIAHGDAYAHALKDYVSCHPEATAEQRYESLAIADIQMAADALRPVFEQTHGRDGYASLEVSPRIADDAEATVKEAHRLWHAVNRPNLMIKIPATQAGLSAIRQSIAEGININVTLIFARDIYSAVANAFAEGLEERLRVGKTIAGVASVASFFVSRIDSAVDSTVDQRVANGDRESKDLRELRGHVAIANAKLAYQEHREFLETNRWKRLQDAGASPQRLLWASTGVKDPAYRDTIYAEELIGKNTVNTMPPDLLIKFRDHGQVTNSLERDLDAAKQVLIEAERLQLDLETVCARLLDEGLKGFETAFESLLGAVSSAQIARETPAQ